MIAADTSTCIAFLEGRKGEDAQLLDQALEDRQVLMVPVVLTELLSDPKLPSGVAETLSEVPKIEIEPGYWQRAGVLRAKALAKGRKARLGDALIAQSCIDRGIPLLTRDRDFRAFGDAASPRSCNWDWNRRSLPGCESGTHYSRRYPMRDVIASPLFC